MALGNWASVCWDRQGNPVSEEFSVGNVTFELYKNWMHVKDHEVWKQGNSHYIEPIVMRVLSGDFEYKNFHILAKRGHQDSIYVAIYYQSYNKEDPYFGRMFFGISGSAYNDNGDYIGITKYTINDFKKWIRKKADSDAWWLDMKFVEEIEGV